MGLLVLFFLGIAAILIIAKFAAKMRPEEEKLLEEPANVDHPPGSEHRLDEDETKETLDALITILTRKEILNPDELLLEIAANRKVK